MSNHSTSTVEYREVNGYPGYRVGDDGSVWSSLISGGKGGIKNTRIGNEWKKLKPGIVKGGYLSVNLRRCGYSKTISVHHLILISFGFARPSSKHETRHLNGIPSDNRLCNLKWGTSKENSADTVNHGNSGRGEKRWNAKLTEDDVKRIRNDFDGLSNKKVSDIFGVSEGNVRTIRHRITWKHVA